MALRRSSQKMTGTIWPGFVDAMTALLMVMMFVLTIFMVVQSVLRETITAQDSQLDELSAQVATLADALGLERSRGAQLETDLGAARAESTQQAALIASLTGQLASRDAALDAAGARIADFEARVLALIAERDAARGEGAALTASLAELEAAQSRLVSEQEALQLALSRARTEVDAATEAARLDAARREALEALIADLRQRAAEGQAALTDAEARAALAAQALTDADARTALTTRALTEAEARAAQAAQALTEAEAARLAEAAAAEALRRRLQSADAELTAMTLVLEDQRKRAEDTLTQLAAANAALGDLDARLAAALLAQQASAADLAALQAQGTDMDTVRRDLAAAIAARLAAEAEAGAALSEAERRAALLATAQTRLSEEQARSAGQARQVSLLNEQVAALRAQLGGLQDLLAAADAADEGKRLQLEALGTQLNTALAQVAAEQRRRAQLEEAERKRLEAEKQNLERFRSEFFGQLRDVLAGREGVRVVGDRFVFSSEVLFNVGAADLAPEGRAQIARVAAILSEVADSIPPGIDWILRVDGHTDNVPLSGAGQFADNWALSQARALSVVRFLQDDLGFPPERLAATGFGEHRPVATGNSPEARAQNRRIELKLTER